MRSALLAMGVLPGEAFRFPAAVLSLMQIAREDLLRLDYISCLLTILSTVLIGRRLWHGWIVAGVNSVIICLIGIHTGQVGFIPANLFCLAIYAWNLRTWKRA